MNTRVEITVDRFIDRLTKAVDAGATAAAIALEGGIRSGMGRGQGFGVPSKPGQFPNTQFGDLRNSFGYVKAKEGTAYVGSGLPYSRYLNNGARIKPRGRALAIPLSVEAKKMMHQHGGRARSVINALKFDKRRPIFFVKGKSGLVVMRGYGPRSKKQAEPMFLITSKTVIIAPRPWGKLGIAKARNEMIAQATAAAKAVMEAA